MGTSKFLLKALILFLTILLGVTGGIYVGFALTNSRSEIRFQTPEMSGEFGVPENLLLNLEIGDTFPEVSFITFQKNSGRLLSELQGKKSGLIFYGNDCLACPSHMDQWNQIVSPKLKSNVQEIVLVSDKSFDKLKEIPSHLKDKRLLFIDWISFSQKYHLAFLPISMTIDESGIIQHIQYGQRGGIDYKILKFLTTHNI